MKRRLVLTAAVTIAVAALLGGCKKEEPPAPKAEAPKARLRKPSRSRSAAPRR